MDEINLYVCLFTKQMLADQLMLLENSYWGNFPLPYFQDKHWHFLYSHWHLYGFCSIPFPFYFMPSFSFFLGFPLFCNLTPHHWGDPHIRKQKGTMFIQRAWLICRVCMEQKPGMLDLFSEVLEKPIWNILRDCGGIPVGWKEVQNNCKTHV